MEHLARVPECFGRKYTSRSEAKDKIDCRPRIFGQRSDTSHTTAWAVAIVTFSIAIGSRQLGGEEKDEWCTVWVERDMAGLRKT